MLIFGILQLISWGILFLVLREVFKLFQPKKEPLVPFWPPEFIAPAKEPNVPVTEGSPDLVEEAQLPDEQFDKVVGGEVENA